MKAGQMAVLAELRNGVTTSSAEDTRRCGALLAAALPPDATVALHGDLGAGKTTFVQGLARGFGLSTQVTRGCDRNSAKSKRAWAWRGSHNTT